MNASSAALRSHSSACLWAKIMLVMVLAYIWTPKVVQAQIQPNIKLKVVTKYDSLDRATGHPALRRSEYHHDRTGHLVKLLVYDGMGNLLDSTDVTWSADYRKSVSKRFESGEFVGGGLEELDQADRIVRKVSFNAEGDSMFATSYGYRGDLLYKETSFIYGRSSGQWLRTKQEYWDFDSLGRPTVKKLDENNGSIPQRIPTTHKLTYSDSLKAWVMATTGHKTTGKDFHIFEDPDMQKLRYSEHYRNDGVLVRREDVTYDATGRETGRYNRYLLGYGPKYTTKTYRHDGLLASETNFEGSFWREDGPVVMIPDKLEGLVPMDPADTAIVKKTSQWKGHLKGKPGSKVIIPIQGSGPNEYIVYHYDNKRRLVEMRVRTNYFIHSLTLFEYLEDKTVRVITHYHDGPVTEEYEYVFWED